MKRLIFLWLVLVCPWVHADSTAWILDIKEAIGPATADYVKRNLTAAAATNVTLVILRLDTPGGLDMAMRDIIQAIIASPVPVVSYVAPSGARAASAGTYILYASHVAAMAPGTNLGAATPVQIGGFGDFDNDSDEPSSDKKTPAKTDADKSSKKPDSVLPSSSDTLTRKMVNDAEAYIRSLAQLHGRNAEWAAQAVRQAASLPAEEALNKQVVDLIAVNIAELLERLNGRVVKVQGKLQTLVTPGLVIETREPDWRNRFLGVITNPNIAYILMLLGIYGLFFEMVHPGSVVPGVIGGISLLLALLAFQVLPINYAGLALILLGIAFVIGETFLPGFGILGLGGLTAFVIGSIILMDSDLPEYTISRSLIVGIALFTVGFFLVIIKMALTFQNRPIISGREQLLGSEGECLECEGESIRVHLHGEEWQAHCATELVPGQRVRVVAIHGLTLTVEPILSSLNHA